MCSVIDIAELTFKSYLDQTRHFPVKYYKGNQCILFLYYFDTRTNHAISLKNRHVSSITQPWKDCYRILKHHEESPSFHILDNEQSQDLREVFTNDQVKFQLVIVLVNRRYAGERAIRMFKIT